MSRLNHSAACAIIVALSSAACVVSGRIEPTVAAPSEIDLARLWQEPADLAARDFFHGPGGPELMPDPSTTFTFVAEDRSGYSPGYDVRDPRGLEWSVKLGPEAQAEVVTSRILWGLGYHQPPTYYLEQWAMSGGPGGVHPPGRFRPKLPDRAVVGEWDWYENEFINSLPFRGLIVANLIVNNWDWKTSNNKIYDVNGERLYVVQDVGASLGKTDYPGWLAWYPTRGFGQGSRNDLEDFEEQGFIERVDGDRVEFVYHGIHGNLVEQITVRDVIWTTERLARISDGQWHDIFRAGGYPDDQARRYIARLKEKITQGLQLATGPRSQ